MAVLILQHVCLAQIRRILCPILRLVDTRELLARLASIVPLAIASGVDVGRSIADTTPHLNLFSIVGIRRFRIQKTAEASGGIDVGGEVGGRSAALAERDAAVVGGVRHYE